MFYVWLNGKNLRRFKDLQKAKLFAIKYMAEHLLVNALDDFVICNPCDKTFEKIDVFSLKHIY